MLTAPLQDAITALLRRLFPQNPAPSLPSAKPENVDSAILEEAMALYTENEENNRVTRMSAQVEYENYCQNDPRRRNSRICKENGLQKLGIATCVGLITEARAAAAIPEPRI